MNDYFTTNTIRGAYQTGNDLYITPVIRIPEGVIANWTFYGYNVAAGYQRRLYTTTRTITFGAHNERAPAFIEEYRLENFSEGGRIGLKAPPGVALAAPGTYGKLSPDDIVTVVYDYSETSPRPVLTLVTVDSIEVNPIIKRVDSYWARDSLYTSAAVAVVEADPRVDKLGHYVKGLSLSTALPDEFRGTVSELVEACSGSIMWSDD